VTADLTATPATEKIRYLLLRESGSLAIRPQIIVQLALGHGIKPLPIKFKLGPRGVKKEVLAQNGKIFLDSRKIEKKRG